MPGDIVILEAGDAVPADGRIVYSASMKVEEAALTGESVAVSKHPDALELGQEKDIPLGDRKNMAYMGSTVVYGRGRMVVTGTGMNTEMGKIADALTTAKEEQTPLQIKLNQLSKILSFLVIGICSVIFAAGYHPRLSQYHRNGTAGYLYGGGKPCGGGNSRGLGSGGDHCSVHRRDQNVRQTRRSSES